MKALQWEGETCDICSFPLEECICDEVDDDEDFSRSELGLDPEEDDE